MEEKILANWSWSGRSLMKSVQNMAKGAGRVVGDGSCVNITKAIWVGKNHITFRQDLQDQEPNKPIWVSSLITSQRKWDTEILNKWFEKETSAKIDQYIFHFKRGMTTTTG